MADSALCASGPSKSWRLDSLGRSPARALEDRGEPRSSSAATRLICDEAARWCCGRCVRRLRARLVEGQPALLARAEGWRGGAALRDELLLGKPGELARNVVDRVEPRSVRVFSSVTVCGPRSISTARIETSAGIRSSAPGRAAGTSPSASRDPSRAARSPCSCRGSARGAHRRLVEVQHGLAVRRLVAREAQRVQRQRVLLRRRLAASRSGSRGHAARHRRDDGHRARS